MKRTQQNPNKPADKYWWAATSAIRIEAAVVDKPVLLFGQFIFGFSFPHSPSFRSLFHATSTSKRPFFRKLMYAGSHMPPRKASHQVRLSVFCILLRRRAFVTTISPGFVNKRSPTSSISVDIPSILPSSFTRLAAWVLRFASSFQATPFYRCNSLLFLVRYSTRKARCVGGSFWFFRRKMHFPVSDHAAADHSPEMKW